MNSCPSNSNFPEWNNTWALWRIITHNFCCNISLHHCASGIAFGASRLIFTSLISEFVNPSILLIGTSFNRTRGVWIYTGALSSKYTSIYFFFYADQLYEILCINQELRSFIYRSWFWIINMHATAYINVLLLFEGVTFAWLTTRKEIKFEFSHVLMNITCHVLTNGSRKYMGKLSLTSFLF